MARGTIKQRIALEGADKILADLRELGQQGEAALAKIKTAGDKAVVSPNLSKNIDATKKSLGDLSKSADGIKTAEQAFTSFGLNVQRALAGGKDLSSPFKLLGVSLRDAAGNARPLGQVLVDVAEKFRLLPDSGAKAQLALKVFGSAGVALLPTLNRGKIGITELATSIQKLNGSGGATFFETLRIGALAFGAAIGGAAVAVGTAIAALQRLASSAADAAKKVQDSANAAGLNTQKYQELASLADKAGVSQKGLVDGLNSLNDALKKNAEAHDKRTEAQKAADEAADKLGITIRRGGQDAAKASGDIFDLGIKVTSLADKSQTAVKMADDLDVALIKLLTPKGAADFLKLQDPIDKLELLSKAFQKLDQQQQLDLARKLGISDLLPLLQQGAAGIDALRQKITEQNRALTENEIKVGTDLKAAYTNLGSAVDSAKDKLGLIFAPSFTQAANAAADAIDRNRGALLEWGNALNKASNEGIPAFIAQMEKMGTALSGTAGGLSKDGQTLQDFLSKLGTGDLSGAFKGIGESIQKEFDQIPERWQRTIDTLRKMPVFNDLSDVSERWARVRQTILDDWNKGLDQWKDLGQKTAEAFATGFDAIKGLVKASGDSLFDALFKDLQDIPERLARVKETIGKAFNELFGIGSAKAADAPSAGSPFTSLEAEASAAFARIKQAATETVTAVNAAFAGAAAALPDAAGAASDAGNGVAAPTGPFSSIATGATEAFTQLKTLATDTVKAIADAFAGLTIDWTKLAGGAGTVWQGIKDKATETADFIKTAFAEVKIDWTALTNGLQEAIDAITTALQKVVDAVKSVGSETQGAGSVVKTAADGMVAAFNAVRGAALEAAKAAASISTGGSDFGASSDRGNGFASGGHVRGRGTSTSDSIPAYLSDYEFVVQARAVRKYGLSFLNALNAGRLKLPGYSTGGLVKSVQQFKFGLPAFSGGGLATLGNPMRNLVQHSAMGGGMVPANIHIPGHAPVPVMASSSALQQLARAAGHKKLTTGGTKPSWYK